MADVKKYGFTRDLSDDSIKRFIREYHSRNFGFSRKQWIKWAILDKTYAEIMAETGLRIENIQDTWKIICRDLFNEDLRSDLAKEKIKNHFRTLIALDLLGFRDLIIDRAQIWQDIFGEPNNYESSVKMRVFFNNLGDDYTVNYVSITTRGWVDFFDLEY
ncbi:MAG: hypothetical protein ACFFAH_03345 [Promethearchaeota archaeon]